MLTHTHTKQEIMGSGCGENKHKIKQLVVKEFVNIFLM